MNKVVKRISLMLSAMAIGAMFVGCGENKSSSASENTISGSILAAGSTALQPLAEKAGKEFSSKNPDVTVSVQGGGSGTGITQVSQGSVQIGNSDVPASAKIKDKAKLDELVDHEVCGIGFALVVHNDVAIDDIKVEDIQKIFTGEITNWKEVGGNDMPIVVVNRPTSSGTRATFKDTILKDKNEKEGLGMTQDSTSAAKKVVQDTKGAISYVALSNLRNDNEKQGLKILKINGVEPTMENIASKKYVFWSYEHMITKGEPSKEVKAYIDFIKSDEFKQTIISEGYVPMGEFK